MSMRRRAVWSLMLVACWLSGGRPAEAYIGPGAGISVVGTAIAFVGALIFAIVGFVWYPIKRLMTLLRSRSRGDGDGEAAAS
jgi:hypothetical protein